MTSERLSAENDQLIYSRALSRYLSLVLRHDPSAAHIELDDEGWVDIEVLLRGMAEAGKSVERAQLESVVEKSDKQRFVIRDGRIRANQGHSVKIDLALTPTTPPDFLFHGTAERFWEGIAAEGLSSMARQHVHLSIDVPTASKVGVRHGKLLLLSVASGEMHREGHAFYVAENGVWLTDIVPPHFLSKANESDS